MIYIMRDFYLIICYTNLREGYIWLELENVLNVMKKLLII